MTNNLKILTILSIFVFILTGYFYFSSTSVKNQIISNNNNDEKKDNRKITDINNKDSNKKDNEEKTSKLSILKIIIIVILIIIIIIGVIVFIIVNRKKVNKFEFNEESKKDFAKENFCPNFFVIIPELLRHRNICDAKQNAESFFEILANSIIYARKGITKIKVPLTNDANANAAVIGTNILYFWTSYFIDLDTILRKIAVFGYLSKDLIPSHFEDLEEKNINTNEIDEFNSKMKKKYGEEFDSYLCAYLLYYLSETITNIKKEIDVEFHGALGKKEKTTIETKFNYFSYKKTQEDSYIKAYSFFTYYNINYNIINKILEKLLPNDNDRPSHVKFYEI